MLRSSASLRKCGTVLNQYRPFLPQNNSNAPLRYRGTSRSTSTVADLKNFPSVGEKLHGFTVQQKRSVEELHLAAIHLKHDKTDADYLHVARDDKNNVFGIGFKTNPPDATGIPHILEHTTLCGSEKYPVRDPFFKMLPRSLSNFMNAFTASDHTTYPFATTNPQDFQNLLSVYLDSTLHPLLKKDDFRQEGWRLGPEDPRAFENPKSSTNPDDIVFKGVVYNEMKGQMSDATYLYYIKFREHIFPAINNSGGDPEKITDLTHEQLVDFSKKNYHPSNAKIVTYGNIPLDVHLEQVGSVLDNFTKKDADKEIKLPLDLNQGPLDFTVPGPIDTFASEDKQFKTSTAWYMGDSADVVETFSVNILSSLLLDGYGSPMYKALIESGLGSSFTPNTGLDTSGRIPTFSIGLSGIGEGDVPKVKEAVQSVFKESFAAGFSDEKVQGLLHQLELALKHKTANFGIGVMDKAISSWFNGSDPIREMAWNDILNEFRERYEKGGYMEQLLQKYLLNDKSLTFTMVGSPTFSGDLDKLEKVRKDQKLAELSQEMGSMEAAVKQLQKEELELLNVQEGAKDVDLSCLPSLHVKDIAREKERISTRESKLDEVDVVWREAPTNGLTYFQAMNAYEGLPGELRVLLPLFNDCVMRLGTNGRSMEVWEDLIKLKTGGVSSSSFLVSSPKALDTFSEGFQFAGHALTKNVPEMLEIIKTLITETDFASPMAPSMVQELLRSATNGALDAVASSGHRYAVNAAASGLAQRFWIQEQQSGLTQVQAMANLLHDAQTSPDRLQELIQKLQLIQSFAISRSQHLRVRMVCEPEAVAQNESALQKWLDVLPQRTGSMPTEQLSQPTSNSSRVLYDLPYKVYYSGLVRQTVPFADPASASLSVLSQLLTHNYLHAEIREKGGAYGAGASSAPLKATFNLSSYRDPNPMNTLKVFQNCGVFARERVWTEREIDEAKLAIFQSLDAPTSVDEEGMRYFMSGVTHEMDQHWREHVLDVTAKDINEAAHRFLVDGSKEGFCVLGEKKDWADTDGWDVRKMSMGA